MLKQWVLHENTPEADAFAREIGVASLIGQILWHRGIRTHLEAQEFLHPEESAFYDPFRMEGMEAAAARIQYAVKHGEKIVVYGDYDVDGMTSTALLTKNLRALGGDVSYYIPNRFTEGYGLNLPAMQAIHADGCALLITVDCGISSLVPVQEMQGAMDIIITDHHLPGDMLPPALAVLDPHRADCSYPDKNLAGVGVAFKLCQALWQKHGKMDHPDDLDLVALGTISDLVPLTGENRKIAKLGLQHMSEHACTGIQALISIAGLDGKAIHTGQVSFQLAPRLNAAGRMDTALRGVELLMEKDMMRAVHIASEMNALNTERQELEQKILDEARDKIGDVTPYTPAIIVAGDDWNAGVIGIVASRLVDQYYRPSIVFTLHGDLYKGSCRSIAGLHMYEALSACHAYLIQFGGHEMAAGLSLRPDQLEPFSKAFSQYVRQHLSRMDFVPKVRIETLISPMDWTVDMVEQVSLMEPYGMGNPRPVFGWKNIRPRAAFAIGSEGKHLRMELGAAGHSVKGLYWNYGMLSEVVTEEYMDLAYTPSINEWNGVRSVQCMVESLRPAEGELIFPTREILKSLYRYLHGVQNHKGCIPYTPPILTRKYAHAVEHISLYTVTCAVQIFQELGILMRLPHHTGWQMRTMSGKAKLLDAPTYRWHQDIKEVVGYVE